MNDHSSDTDFFAIATQRPVVMRAARIALVVGIVLAIINHADKFINGTVDLTTLFKIILTFVVPYSVSTYSSVQTVRDQMQDV